MKILFLDIDGVCNCATTSQRHRGYIGIDPHIAFMVGKIQLDTDCKIVLSSAWRCTPEGIKEVKEQIADLLDVTPNLSYTDEERESMEHIHRGREIKDWLDRHPEVTRYAILDDNNDMLPEQQEHFFKTSWETGITEEIAKAVTDHLNKTKD